MPDSEQHTHKPGGLIRIGLGNLAFLGVLLLGAGVLALSFPDGPWRWLAPLLYVAYGVAGTFWLILFVCPYCAAYGSRLCPSGHGLLAARFRPRQSGPDFPRQFRRHIPVIVPVWFVPLIVVGGRLITDFSWGLLALLAVFCIEAFVVLPLTSKRHGCARCPQRGNCPWIRGSHGRSRTANGFHPPLPPCPLFYKTYRF